MKTLLICHDGAELTREGMARWLASFSELAGVVVLRETRQRVRRRVRREVERVGLARFLDVTAFRLYYRLFLASRDDLWQRRKLAELCAAYPEIPADTPVLYTHSPNSPEAEEFIRACAPDIMLARCKTLLKPRVFNIPAGGTFVMHPGVCPEYRNAHGCFWALARGDLGRVGMTLLRIDEGVDTGPVYGYYTYDFDERRESHVRIQHRVVLDNLERLRARLLDIGAGAAAPIETSGRASATWGQPWLTAYLKWKYRARQRAKGEGHEGHITPVP